MNKRLGYFVAGALAFVLCGWIPGPQGSVSPGSDATLSSLTVADGTGAAPSIHGTTDAQAGFFFTSNNIGVAMSGFERMRLNANGLNFSTGMVRWGSSLGALDLAIRRSAASTLTVDGDGSGTTAAKLAVSGIAPMTSGQTLVLYDEGGDAALTIATNGAITANANTNHVFTGTLRGTTLQTSGFTFTASASLVSTTVDLDLNDNFLQLSEMSAPTGTANEAKLYAKDNGSGKTQLVVIFGSGAEQVLATEP